jgi:tetratricopeptide (TPR) repeat protein
MSPARRLAPALLAAALALPSLARAGLLEGDHPLVEQGTRAYHKGDFDGARLAYEEAARQLPGRAELDYNLGDVYMKLGRPDDAKRAFRAALGQADDSLKARDYYNLGNALAGLDQKQDAIAAYRQALKVDPHLEPARHNLEVLLRKPPESKPSPGDGGQGDGGGDAGREGGQDGGRKRDSDAGRDDGGDAGPGDKEAGPDAGDGGGDSGRGDAGRGADASRADGGADGGTPERSDQGEGDAGASDGGTADASSTDGGSRDAASQQSREPESADAKNVDQQEADRLLDAMRRNEKQFLMQQHNKKARPRANPERDW